MAEDTSVTAHSRSARTKITQYCDAQSAVERERVLRLVSLFWRLRRATMMETGLFNIQAEHLRRNRQTRQLSPNSRDVIHAMFERAESDSGIKLSTQIPADLTDVSANKSGRPSVKFAAMPTVSQSA